MARDVLPPFATSATPACLCLCRPAATTNCPQLNLRCRHSHRPGKLRRPRSGATSSWGYVLRTKSASARSKQAPRRIFTHHRHLQLFSWYTVVQQLASNILLTGTPQGVMVHPVSRTVKRNIYRAGGQQSPVWQSTPITSLREKHSRSTSLGN